MAPPPDGGSPGPEFPRAYAAGDPRESSLRMEAPLQAAPPDPAAHISPSLWPAQLKRPAFEIKFLLPLDAALSVQSWAHQHMDADPHADPALGNAYIIRSVYLDTDQFDIFHRAPGFRRRKYRLRQYGRGETVFLERKTKSGDRVAKRRSAVPRDEIHRLLHGDFDPSWPGDWFHRRLAARQLRPRCFISYTRTACVGTSCDGPIRLTIDRHIRCQPTAAYDVCLPAQGASPGLPLFADRAILELKYRTAMPALFKRLVEELCLTPSPASKYRLGIQTCDLAHPASEAG